jgi:hypothetical protein
MMQPFSLLLLLFRIIGNEDWRDQRAEDVGIDWPIGKTGKRRQAIEAMRRRKKQMKEAENNSKLLIFSDLGIIEP